MALKCNQASLWLCLTSELTCWAEPLDLGLAPWSEPCADLSKPRVSEAAPEVWAAAGHVAPGPSAPEMLSCTPSLPDTKRMPFPGGCPSLVPGQAPGGPERTAEAFGGGPYPVFVSLFLGIPWGATVRMCVSPHDRHHSQSSLRSPSCCNTHLPPKSVLPPKESLVLVNGTTTLCAFCAMKPSGSDP